MLINEREHSFQHSGWKPMGFLPALWKEAHGLRLYPDRTSGSHRYYCDLGSHAAAGTFGGTGTGKCNNLRR